VKPQIKTVISFAAQLLRPFWRRLLVATLLGSVNSLAAVSLLSIIDRELRAGAPTSLGALGAFAGFFIVMLASEIASGAEMGRVGQEVVASLRKDMTKKILMAPISEIEQVQSHRILSALQQDAGHLSEFSRMLTHFVVALCEVAGCAIYLFYLSPPMFLASAVVWAGSYWFTRHVLKGAYTTLTEERVAYDDLQKHYGALINGAKELKISRERRSRFYQGELIVTIDRLRDVINKSATLFLTANSLDNASFFVLAGALLALAPALGAGTATLSSFVLALLFLRGPVSVVSLSLPEFSRAGVSFQRVRELSERFASFESDLLATGGRAQADFKRLELRGAVYAFPHAVGAAPFTLGPIDLTLKKNEILFVTGENGSGKTTLVKLILGLYAPKQGEIQLNGEVVTDVNRDDYRQNFSAIFFDFYLFDDLIVADEAASEAVRSYLERLNIAHKVTVEEGRLSTLELSAGQRKRLALIGTYLEERPIVVFDEWAAEQDPTFRRIFYTEILQELKRQGKTLIVVSHDDRYFDAADRILHIREGKVSMQGEASAESRPLSG
jgi:putative pyoverdin transport system ATP-binding/permease protein